MGMCFVFEFVSGPKSDSRLRFSIRYSGTVVAGSIVAKNIGNAPVSITNEYW